MRSKTDYTERQSPFRAVPELRKTLYEIKRIMPNYSVYQIINLAIFFFRKVLKGGVLHLPKISPTDDVEEKFKIKTEA